MHDMLGNRASLNHSFGDWKNLVYREFVCVEGGLIPGETVS